MKHKRKILISFFIFLLLLILIFRQNNLFTNLGYKLPSSSSDKESIYAKSLNENSKLTKITDNFIPESKEYKFLLKGKMFSDIEKQTNVIYSTIESEIKNFQYPIKIYKNVSKEKTRILEYWDTKNQDFKKNNIILRKRTKFKKGKEINEITLKTGLKDRSKIFDYLEKYDRKIKIEEDILIQNNDSLTLKKYTTYSNTILNFDIENHINIGKLLEIFPEMNQYSIDKKLEIFPVADFKVHETVIKVCSLDFGNEKIPNLEITIWQKEDQLIPMVVEISYRLEFPTDSVISEDKTLLYDEFLKFLYKIFSDIAILNKTKTQIYYETNILDN